MAVLTGKEGGALPKSPTVVDRTVGGLGGGVTSAALGEEEESGIGRPTEVVSLQRMTPVGEPPGPSRVCALWNEGGTVRSAPWDHWWLRKWAGGGGKPL